MGAGARTTLRSRGTEGSSRSSRAHRHVAGQALPTALAVYDARSGLSRTIAEGNIGATYEPKLSANAKRLVFTDASAESGEHAQIFARSLVDGSTVLVSRASGPDGSRSNGDAFEATVSADGGTVAFSALATNLGAAGRRARIYVRDLGREATSVVHVASDGNTFDPALSADGRFVAFAQRPVDEHGRGSATRATVWRYDRATGRATLISRADGPRGPMAGGLSSQPAISSDGRFVVFASDAGNLSGRKPQGIPGVFLRDTATGRTRLLSTHAPRGTAPGGAPTPVQAVPNGYAPRPARGVPARALTVAPAGEADGWAGRASLVPRA